MRILTACLLGGFLSLASAQEQDLDFRTIALDHRGGAFAAISVPDLDQSLDWYGKVFGLAQTFSHSSESGDLSIVILSGPGLMLEIQEHAAASAAETPQGKAFLQHGVFKFGAFVLDLDNAMEVAREQDVSIVMEPFGNQDGRLRSAVISDNNGNLIQLFERQ